MRILLILLLFTNVAFADEEQLHAQIECLKQELLETRDRIAKLETITSLLMAGYQSDKKTEAFKKIDWNPK